MTAKTPGQRAYEAYWARCGETEPNALTADWERLSGWQQESWEAAAQAVLNDAFPGLKRELREAKELAKRDQETFTAVTADLEAQLTAVTAENEARKVAHDGYADAMRAEREREREQLAAATAERERFRTALETLVRPGIGPISAADIALHALAAADDARTGDAP
jgi:nucleotide-binding universal stress UspA family protein